MARQPVGKGIKFAHHGSGFSPVSKFHSLVIASVLRKLRQLGRKCLCRGYESVVDRDGLEGIGIVRFEDILWQD